MTRTLALPAVEGVDNRGTEEVPFGFVYFKDTRIGFASLHGVFKSNGWGSTNRHLVATIEHLKTLFPNFDWNISV